MTPRRWIKMNSNTKGRIYCQQNIRQKSVLHSHRFSFTGYDHTQRNVYVPPKFLLPFLFTRFFSISFVVRRLRNHPDDVSYQLTVPYKGSPQNHSTQGLQKIRCNRGFCISSFPLSSIRDASLSKTANMFNSAPWARTTQEKPVSKGPSGSLPYWHKCHTWESWAHVLCPQSQWVHQLRLNLASPWDLNLVSVPSSQLQTQGTGKARHLSVSREI